MFLKVITAMVLVALPTTEAYSKGAPKESCVDMIPQHEVGPQTSPFPYAIDISQNELRSGEKLQVIITGSHAAKKFRGFFIQARVGNIPVGRFDPAPGVNLVNCGDSRASAATHVSSAVKEKVALTWNAPPGLSETVRFRVTVAEDGGTFWVGHLSAPVVIKS